MVKKFFFVLIILTAATACDKEVSVSPTDSKISTGYMYIESIPEGAMIYLNGKISGRTTPDSLKWLESGNYEVSLKKKYYRDSTFYINIEEDVRNNLFIDYTNNPLMRGQIECITNPSNASVYLHDSLIAYTPCVIGELWPGVYDLKFKNEGYKDADVSLAVVSNQATETAVTMIDTTKWTEYVTGETDIPCDDLLSVAAAPNNDIWIGTQGKGLVKFDGSTWTSFTKADNAIPNDTVTCLAFDNSGELWIGTRDGFVHYSNGAFYNYGMGIIEDIAVDEQNIKWIASYDGLIYLNDEKLSIYNSYNSALTKDRVTEILLAPNGDKWVGTYGQGIARLSNGEWEFYTKDNCGLPGNRITAGAVDLNGDFWFGHSPWAQEVGGLSNFSGGTWSRILGIPSSLIEFIYIDELNMKWLATGGGLGLISPDGTISKFTYENTGILFQHVSSISEDNNGDLWIATLGAGLVKLRKDRL